MNLSFLIFDESIKSQSKKEVCSVSQQEQKTFLPSLDFSVLKVL